MNLEPEISASAANQRVPLFAKVIVITFSSSQSIERLCTMRVYNFSNK